MVQIFLWILAFLLSSIGIFFIIKAFFMPTSNGKSEKQNQKNILIKGWIGVILMFCAGLVFIYFYSLQPIPTRLLKEHIETDELPDISLLI